MTRLVLDRELATGEQLRITGDEARYLIRVRRQRPDDRVELRSASGRRFRAVVRTLEREAATVEVEEELPPAPDPWPVTLLVAVPKRHLLDEVVRRTSEIGISRLVPITCERSVVDPGPAKLERWRRIATESMRQCGRGQPLIVDPVRPFATALEEHAGSAARIVLHPDAEQAPSLLEQLRERPASITAAIGPEGGFSDAEIGLATARNYRPARLGRLIMRVETAAVITAGLSIAFVGGFD